MHHWPTAVVLVKYFGRSSGDCRRWYDSDGGGGPRCLVGGASPLCQIENHPDNASEKNKARRHADDQDYVAIAAIRTRAINVDGVPERNSEIRCRVSLLHPCSKLGHRKA